MTWDQEVDGIFLYFPIACQSQNKSIKNYFILLPLTLKYQQQQAMTDIYLFSSKLDIGIKNHTKLYFSLFYGKPDKFNLDFYTFFIFLNGP